MKSELVATTGCTISIISLVINICLIIYLSCYYPPLGFTSIGRVYLDNAHCYYDNDCLDDCNSAYNYNVEYSCYRNTCYCKYRSFLNSKPFILS